jgi:hypothetical protein
MLIEAGAPIDAKNEQGKTARDLFAEWQKRNAAGTSDPK